MLDKGDIKYHVFINGMPRHTGNENRNLHSSKNLMLLSISVDKH